MRVFVALLLTVLLTGCPPDGPDQPDPSPDPSASAAPDASAPEASPADPLEGSVFSKEELFEIYAAYQEDDATKRNEVLRKHRLVDANGKEQAVRVKAFDQALQTYAERDPEGWAVYVDSLGS
jgi:hypothetical protein